MGEYSKIYERIRALKQRKKDLQDEIDDLKDKIYEIDLEIADWEGYLLELDYIDNGGSK